MLKTGQGAPDPFYPIYLVKLLGVFVPSVC